MAEEKEMEMQTPGEVAQQKEVVIKPEKKKRSKRTPKGKRVFGTRPPEITFTTEQRLLQSLFGGGQKVIFNGQERNPPQINYVLTSGSGILKSEDDAQETRNLMASGTPSGFFGGQRRQSHNPVNDGQQNYNPIFGNPRNQSQKRRRNPLF